jgi:hypothetical protein
MEKKALNATTVTQSFSHYDRNDSGNLIKRSGWYLVLLSLEILVCKSATFSKVQVRFTAWPLWED